MKQSNKSDAFTVAWQAMLAIVLFFLLLFIGGQIEQWRAGIWADAMAQRGIAPAGMKR